MSIPHALPPPWHPLHYIPAGCRALLDVGCNTAEALSHAHELGVRELYGIDLNPDAIAAARRRLAHAEVASVVHGSADELPFAAGSADVVVMSEVLEHLPEALRPRAIAEAHRVLAKDGRLIVTVPAAGLFAFLDPANARHALPWLFERLARRLPDGGREQALRGQKHGVERHHHFHAAELMDLLDTRFTVEEVRYRGALLAPLCNWLQFPFYRLRRLDSAWLRRISALLTWDMAREYPAALAYNVLLVARRNAD